MVNRDNWKAVKAFLKFKQDIEHLDTATIYTSERVLRYLLEWADDVHFTKADKVRPTFPEYIDQVKRKDTGKPITDQRVSQTLMNAKQFLKWAKEHLPEMKAIDLTWIETMRSIRRNTPIVTERQAVTLEMVRRLMKVDWPGVLGQRAKATAAFLFLSGMRITAFATMPIKAVDLPTRTIKQDPTLGVLTKFRKRANTLLLDIPDLLQVVADWDKEVRRHATPDDLWFYRFTAGNQLKQGVDRITTRTGRVPTSVPTALKELFERAGLKPMSAHKFRHGHATYALKMTKDMADYKAVSQNLMHANIGITDTVYAILSESDLRTRIDSLGKVIQQTSQRAEPIAQNEIAAIVEETVKRMMQAQADQAAQAGSTAGQPATPDEPPKATRKRKP